MDYFINFLFDIAAIIAAYYIIKLIEQGLKKGQSHED